VITGSGLSTYTVSGPDLQALSETLSHTQGIDMVAPFGTSLHVAGRDAAALEAAIAPFRKQPGLTWSLSQPSLEDVFISLMSRSQDNFR